MNATAPDYDDIVRVVQLYVNGSNDCDVSKYREAFHEDAWIFYTDQDGVLHNQLIADAFPSMGLTTADQNCGANHLGDPGWGHCVCAAWIRRCVGRLRPSHRHGTSWVDFHTLLRTKGVWKITNKTATHATRASWAADQYAERKEATIA